MKCRIRKIGKVISTETPYDNNWILLIKTVIPANARQWHPGQRVWTFKSEWYGFVRQTILDFFGEPMDATGGDCGPQTNSWRDGYEKIKQDIADGVTPNQQRNAWGEGGGSRATSVDHFTTLGVLPSADPDVIKAAYRVLAKKHHPDAGGDEETMARIAEAYTALKKEGVTT